MMIHGAIDILRSLPLRYIDPFLLAESQRTDMRGYVVVSYGETCDMLILCGREIRQCVHVSMERREPIEPEAVKERCRSGGAQARVSLFEAAGSVVEPFLVTLDREPVLRLALGTLSRSQVERLMHTAASGRVLVEKCQVRSTMPWMEFTEIDLDTECIARIFPARRGVLRVYSLAASVTPVPMPTSSRGAAQPAAEPVAATNPAPLPDQAPEARDPAQLSMPFGDESGLVALMGDLCGAFRDALQRSCGKKSRQMLLKAEAAIAKKVPGFGLEALTVQTGAHVPELIRIVIGSAPFLKRNRLREEMLAIIARFYETRHADIERAGVSDLLQNLYASLRT